MAERLKYTTGHHQTPGRDMGKTFSDINLTNVFSGQSPKATEIKAMGPNQTDKLLHSKGNQKENKRQLTEWEKIVSNDAMDKGLISRIYIQTTYTTQQQKSQPPNGKMGKRPEWTFLQARYTRWPTST